MKLLLDQGSPRSAAGLLRKSGFDAVHAGEIGMSELPDEEILCRAAAEGRTIVTLDADFHAHLVLTAAARPSVVRVRIEGLKAEGFVELLVRVLDQCGSDLEAGAVVSVQAGRLRVHRLPIT